MRIKIKCPNKECRKTLVVDTDMAGKKGKCSTCDAVFVIPGKPGSKSKSSSDSGGDSVDLSGNQSSELDEDQRKSADSEARRSSKSRRPRSKPRRQTDDYEDYEDDYEEERPRRKSPSGSRRSRPQPREDYEDDYADDYEEDYGEDYGDDYEEEYDAPPRGRRGRRDDDYGGSGGSAPRPSGRRPSSRKRGPNLKLPSVGLLIMAIAGCVFAGAVGIKIIVELIAILKSTFPVGTMFTFWKIAELIWMGAAIAVIVGYAFLILIPNMHNSKGLTIAALSVGGINLIIQLVFKVIPLFGSGGGLSIFGTSSRPLGSGGDPFIEAMIKIGLMEGLFIAELVLVALAIMAINRQFRDRYNFDSAKALMIPIGIYGGILLLVGLFILILKEEKGMGETGVTIWKWVFYLLRVGSQGMLLWYFISYIFIMFNTRNSVPESG